MGLEPPEADLALVRERLLPASHCTLTPASCTCPITFHRKNAARPEFPDRDATPICATP